MTVPSPRSPRGAFSLVEVTIALGVATFSLLAVFGLMQTGLLSEKATVGQTAAASVLSALYADIASTTATDTATRDFKISMTGSAPQTLYFSEDISPTGAVGAPPTADSRYRASVGITAPSKALEPAQIRIVVSWPAEADPQVDGWPRNAAGTVEVLTALARL